MNRFSRKFLVPATALSVGCFLTSVQAQEIATWAGFRTAAASFTFDDGAPSHVTDGAPVFDKYGYKATFNLVYNWNPNWSGFQKMADNGHEIASHSNSHGNNMSGEEASSKTNIQGKINQAGGITTVAYPNCNVPNANAVKQNYIAGRICNGSWQGVSDIMGKDGPSDWTKLPALMTGSEGSIKSTNDFTGQMQKAIQQNGWVMFLTHGFQGKQNGSATYSPTDISAIDGALSWAKQNDSKIWVTTMRNAAMYVKERKAAKIEAVSGGAAGTKTFKLTHGIADNISKYDYPLSIRVKNDGWTKVSATQGGKAIDASIKDGYIYFDAVPNGGDIVLSSGEGGAVVTPSSSASVGGDPSSSASEPSTTPFKGAIAVPGTIEAENYDVNAFSRSSTESGATGYRTDDAGVVAADVGNALGYTTAGDYFEYTLDVKQSTMYKVTVRGATGNAADGSVTIEVGSKSAKVPVVSKGDWDVYSEAEGDEIEIAAGKQTLRLTINDNYLNVDNIKLEVVSTFVPGTNPGQDSDEGDIAAIKPVRLDVASGMVKCQVFDMNGQLVKTANMVAGNATEVWNGINGSLRNGAYIMRYSVAGGMTQTVRVRK